MEKIKFNFYDESQILILGILSGFEIQDLDLRFLSIYPSTIHL